MEPQTLTRARVGRLEIRVIYDPKRRLPMTYSAEVREFEFDGAHEISEGRLTHICKFDEHGEWKYYPLRKSQPRPPVRADYAAKLAVAAAMSAGSGYDPLSNVYMYMIPGSLVD